MAPQMRIGSKAQVWHGTARQTAGGVQRKGLFQDRDGNIKFVKKARAIRKNPVMMANARGVKREAARLHRSGKKFVIGKS